MGYRVEILPHEMAMIAHMANQRMALRGKGGLPENAINRPEWDVVFDGVIGEFGFAKWAEIFPHMDAETGEYDCVLKGYTVDVKCIRSPKLSLMVPKTQSNHVTRVYALTWWDNPHIEVMGWATRDEVFAEHRFDPTVERPAYKIPIEDLRKFKANGQG